MQKCLVSDDGNGGLFVYEDKEERFKRVLGMGTLKECLEMNQEELSKMADMFSLVYYQKAHRFIAVSGGLSPLVLARYIGTTLPPGGFSLGEWVELQNTDFRRLCGDVEGFRKVFGAYIKAEADCLFHPKHLTEGKVTGFPPGLDDLLLGEDVDIVCVSGSAAGWEYDVPVVFRSPGGEVSYIVTPPVSVDTAVVVSGFINVQGFDIYTKKKYDYEDGTHLRGQRLGTIGRPLLGQPSYFLVAMRDEGRHRLVLGTDGKMSEETAKDYEKYKQLTEILLKAVESPEKPDPNFEKAVETLLQLAEVQDKKHMEGLEKLLQEESKKKGVNKEAMQNLEKLMEELKTTSVEGNSEAFMDALKGVRKMAGVSMTPAPLPKKVEKSPESVPSTSGLRNILGSIQHLKVFGDLRPTHKDAT